MVLNTVYCYLRKFARKPFNIDFFIKVLLQLGYELLLSEMQKKSPPLFLVIFSYLKIGVFTNILMEKEGT